MNVEKNNKRVKKKPHSNSNGRVCKRKCNMCVCVCVRVCVYVCVESDLVKCSTIFMIGGTISDSFVAIGTTESVQSRHLLRDFVRRWLTARRRAAAHAGSHRGDRRRHVARHSPHRRHYGRGPRAGRR